jgi:hypothetical protein
LSPMRNLKRLKRWISEEVKLWPELWSLPAALAMFLISSWLLRLIDPTSGLFDIGVLHVLTVSLVLMPAINAAVFAGIKFNFPILWDYYKKNIIVKDWLNLQPWQRLTFLFVLYLSLFFAGIALLSSFL